MFDEAMNFRMLQKAETRFVRKVLISYSICLESLNLRANHCLIESRFNIV